jgi:hypothetical protein
VRNPDFAIEESLATLWGIPRWECYGTELPRTTALHGADSYVAPDIRQHSKNTICQHANYYKLDYFLRHIFTFSVYIDSKPA